VEDLRAKFFDELLHNLRTAGIKAIIKVVNPANGPTIKLNGICLYKSLQITNPFKDRGVAIYRNITDDAIKAIGGKRSRGKNDWVGAPLTKENYAKLMEILMKVAGRKNMVRDTKMKKADVRIKKEEKKNKRATKVKAKKVRKRGANGTSTET